LNNSQTPQSTNIQAPSDSIIKRASRLELPYLSPPELISLAPPNLLLTETTHFSEEGGIFEKIKEKRKRFRGSMLKTIDSSDIRRESHRVQVKSSSKIDLPILTPHLQTSQI
jgi:hypothetical protein